MQNQHHTIRSLRDNGEWFLSLDDLLLWWEALAAASEERGLTTVAIALQHVAADAASMIPR